MPAAKLVYQLLVFLTLGLPVAIAFPNNLTHPSSSNISEYKPEWSDPARLARHSVLLDITRMGDRLIAVGERGHVLLSEDGGREWIQVPVPSRRMLTGVVMVDPLHTWIVGHDAIILHSPDGGKTWARQFYAPDFEAPLLDVWFQNAEYGLAVGAYNLVLETHDGGKNWNRRSIGKGDAHLYAITSGPDDSLYVVGEFGVLFRSIDHGKTWVSLPTPYHGSFFGILAPANGTLLAFGLRGTLCISDDHGLSWENIETGTTASLLNGIELTDGTIVLVGLSGTVLVSKDGGRSFTATKTTKHKGIAAIAEVGPRSLVTVGETGISQMYSFSEDPSK